MHQGICRFLLILLGCCLLQPARAQCIIDELVKDLNDSKTSQGFKDFIKGNSEGMMAYKKMSAYPQIRKDADVLNATSKFLTKHADFLSANPGKFDDIVRNLASKEVSVRCNTCASGANKGIPTLDVIIDDMDWALTNFKNTNVDIKKLFTEMATQKGLNVYKADGGAYMLSVIRTNAAQDAGYLKSITQFEYKFLANGNFEADLFRTVGGKTHLTEFKSYTSGSWEAFSNSQQNISQLAAYVNGLQEFEYVANVSKLSNVTNPKEFVGKQFMKIFNQNAKETFNPANIIFKDIMYNGKTINITTYQDLIYYTGKPDFVNSSFLNFIKVK